MKTSLYKKVHRDILLEWVYDSNNGISESFDILDNAKDNIKSYIGGDLSNNNIGNQLFPVDINKNKYSLVNTNNFTFLKLTSYENEGPIIHDSIKLHFPVNYNFGEYRGIFLRVYTYDYTNTKFVNLSNFFYDRNNSTQSDILGVISPPILYEDKLWDKIINLEIPSIKNISLQRSSGVPIPGSINDVLTGGVGLSFTSPIFIDFQFITQVQEIGSQVYYLLNNSFTIQIPQSPELEELQIYAQESDNGDFFEINPIYNNSFNDFIDFINQSKKIGKAYYIEYLITLFEQDIKGKTTKFIVENDFNEKTEWRPIIKYSLTKATIDIEMNLIDKVDSSMITRKASYGLKPNQLSKYALNLKKINVNNIHKPKIYVKKNIELAGIDSLTRRDKQEVTVNIDVPSLINITNIHAYSENDLNPKSLFTLDNYHPIGQMKVIINPFDNILKFSLARKINETLDFVDLTNSQNLKITFKSDKSIYEFGLYLEASNASNGKCAFKVPQSSYKNLKKMYSEGNNLFYITTINNEVKTVLYSALFIPSDSQEAISIFSNPTNTSVKKLVIVEDVNPVINDVAIVTKKLINPVTDVKSTSTPKISDLNKPSTNKYKINDSIFGTSSIG